MITIKAEVGGMYVDHNRKSGYSIASFILAVAPITILLLVFLFCLVISGGKSSDNDQGAIWWLMVAAVVTLVPVSIITNILSIVFGVIGIKRQKPAFAWAGIMIVSLEVLSVLGFWVWDFIKLKF